MTFKQFAIAYGATAVVFLALDAIWLMRHSMSSEVQVLKTY